MISNFIKQHYKSLRYFVLWIFLYSIIRIPSNWSDNIHYVFNSFMIFCIGYIVYLFDLESSGNTDIYFMTYLQTFLKLFLFCTTIFFAFYIGFIKQSDFVKRITLKSIMFIFTSLIVFILFLIRAKEVPINDDNIVESLLRDKENRLKKENILMEILNDKFIFFNKLYELYLMNKDVFDNNNTLKKIEKYLQDYTKIKENNKLEDSSRVKILDKNINQIIKLNSKFGDLIKNKQHDITSNINDDKEEILEKTRQYVDTENNDIKDEIVSLKNGLSQKQDYLKNINDIIETINQYDKLFNRSQSKLEEKLDKVYDGDNNTLEKGSYIAAFLTEPFLIMYNSMIMLKCFFTDTKKRELFFNKHKVSFLIILISIVVIIIYFRKSKNNVDKNVYSLSERRVILSPKVYDTRKYSYSLKFKIFIEQQNNIQNKDIEIIDYGGVPKMSYNPKTQLLKIVMKKGRNDYETIFETDNIAHQKWHSFIFNYEFGNMDIFLNGILVSSNDNIVPYMNVDHVVTGAINGIDGGIKHIKYSDDSLNTFELWKNTIFG